MEGVKILVVEDEADLLGLYVERLKGQGYAVETASDGEAAKQKLSKNNFDLLISDVQLPKCTGIELMSWINAAQLRTQVVLITGFSSAIDTQNAYDLGCKRFLAKPVSKDDLVRTTREVLLNSPSDLSNGQKFGCVPIEDFLTGKAILYSIYMRMHDGRFLKIAHSGEDLGPDRIAAFRQKGITSLWLTQDDFKRYIELTRKVATLVKDNAAVSPEKRAQLLRHTFAVTGENMRLAGVSTESIKGAQEAFEASFDALFSGPSVAGLLGLIESQEQSIYNHCATVAMFCALVTRVMGWSSKKNIMLVTMSAYFHDIGLTKLPPHLQKPSLDSCEDEGELMLYQRHPYLGAAMLTDADAPREIVLCVQQHHEDVRGSGYPKRLTRTEILPMSRILFLVDHFYDELLKLPPEKRAPAVNVLDSIVERQRGAFDSPAVFALELALTEPDLVKAKRIFEHGPRRMPR